VDDCGGGYSESIAEMCDELQNPALCPLLITTPNGREESGTSRDCLILNASLTSASHINMFRSVPVSEADAESLGTTISHPHPLPLFVEFAF
jgi:E3 ubiquitin-protein ligase HERC2